MCRAVTCRTCGKTTWAGCGQHVDQVRRTVAATQWCHCDREQATSRTGGWLSALLGRSR